MPDYTSAFSLEQPTDYFLRRQGIDKSPADTSWRASVADLLETTKFKRRILVEKVSAEGPVYKTINSPYLAESFDFRSCADPKRPGFYLACPKDNHHAFIAVPQHCNLRICPICAKRQFWRLRNFYLPHVEKAASSRRFIPKHIELGTDIHLHDEDVHEKIARFYALVPKLFDSLLPPGWRKTQGFISAFEFGLGLRLHFHIYFYGQFIAFPELKSSWAQLTGISNVHVYIKAVAPTQGLNYVIKYATKLTRLLPADMVLLHHVMRGLRRIHSAGIFYGLGEVAALKCEPKVCPVCGETLIYRSAFEGSVALSRDPSLSLQYGNKSPPLGKKIVSLGGFSQITSIASTRL